MRTIWQNQLAHHFTELTIRLNKQDEVGITTRLRIREAQLKCRYRIVPKISTLKISTTGLHYTNFGLHYNYFSQYYMQKRVLIFGTIRYYIADIILVIISFFSSYLFFFSAYILSSKNIFSGHSFNSWSNLSNFFSNIYERKQSIFVLQFEKNKCIVEIFQECTLVKWFIGTTPDEVWRKTGQLRRFTDTQLLDLIILLQKI